MTTTAIDRINAVSAWMTPAYWRTYEQHDAAYRHHCDLLGLSLDAESSIESYIDTCGLDSYGEGNLFVHLAESLKGEKY